MASNDNNWKKILMTALGVVAVGIASYFIIKGLKSEDGKSGNKAATPKSETN